MLVTAQTQLNTRWADKIEIINKLLNYKIIILSNLLSKY